jgi:hypothetical protein
MSEISDAIGREIIRRHFPNADPATVDRRAVWLSPPLVTRLPPGDYLKAGDDDMAQVETFQRAIRAAWDAYSTLPLHVRKNDGIDWVSFARIVRQATGIGVVQGQPAVRSEAIEAMRNNIASAQRMSGQKFTADHPAKVALVEHARNAWRDLAGKEPPVKPSDGPFSDFVADIIEANGLKYSDGKPWGVDRALRAWGTSVGKKAR